MNHWLKNLREDLKLSQDCLGKKLGFKSGQYISNIERGRSSFPEKKIGKLSKLTGQSPLDIIYILVEEHRYRLLSKYGHK